MKVKSGLKLAGSGAATAASVMVGVNGVKKFSKAESTKDKAFAVAEVVIGAAGTVYAGYQTTQMAKSAFAGVKQSKNSPENVANNLQ